MLRLIFRSKATWFVVGTTLGYALGWWSELMEEMDKLSEEFGIPSK
jgi:hypothetical protein